MEKKNGPTPANQRVNTNPARDTQAPGRTNIISLLQCSNQTNVSKTYQTGSSAMPGNRGNQFPSVIGMVRAPAQSNAIQQVVYVRPMTSSGTSSNANGVGLVSFSAGNQAPTMFTNPFSIRGLSPQKNSKRSSYPAYVPIYPQKIEGSPSQQQSALSSVQRFNHLVNNISASIASVKKNLEASFEGQKRERPIDQAHSTDSNSKRVRIGWSPGKRKNSNERQSTPPPILVISSDEEDNDSHNKEKTSTQANQGARLRFVNEKKVSSDISTTANNIAERLPNAATTSDETQRSTTMESLSYGLSILDNPRKILDTLEEVLRDRPTRLRVNLRSLYLYSKMGCLSKVLSILLEDISPAAPVHSEDGKSALHAAASKGHLDVLIVLVYKAGVHVDVTDKYKRTPLYIAVEKGHLQAAQFLHKAGASLLCKNFDGMGLVHVAAHKGHVDILAWLLSRRKSLNEQDNGGWTSLMWAAEDGNAEALQLLIRKGARTDLRDKEQNTVLHWASMAGALEGCEVVLDAKCDVNCVNMYGDTPLHIAAREGNFNIVKLFLLRGADTSVKNKEDKMPMDVCVNNPQVRDAIRLRHAIGHVNIRRKYDCDISRGKERIPISCINEVDDEPLPLSFTYITEAVESHTVSIMKDLLTVKGCKCQNDCSVEMCECIQRNEETKCWYDEGVLDMSFMELDQPVLVECSKLCHCWSYCSNRVVQKGLQFPLQVYKTANMGWGLRTIGPILKGSFVLNYVGEVISDDEADRRGDDSYLFDLDMKNSNDEDNCLDANFYGNCGRFINHSCESNLVPVRVFTHHRDWRFPGIAFFASRDIEAYEGLSFDYGDKFWEIKKKSGLRCQCDSANCKYLDI
ncbi:histone-lysine N-methyltransferase EHMT1-like isoform X2 [Rhopilema esculentum]|uniref:histone-lysine N-methyltransferase EHMT1-like isoform X2 n=1 Tax=Rhopilema esculentum TaxID=499914 RepID=UPI0031E36F2B